MAIQVVNSPRVARKTRSPEHTFLLRQRPFVITPFMLAPVLPGETLKNFVLQSRCVTEALSATRAAAVTGWWLEHYVFYVKLSQMLHADLFKEMMINPAASVAGAADAVASAQWYHPGSGVNWVKQCMAPVVEAYFRDDGEAWDAWLVDGEPIAQLNKKNLWDSVTTAVQNDTADFNLDTNADGTIKASEAAKALVMWEYLRENNLVDMTYEDYLRTFGVRVDPVVDAGIPELVRYSREWTYPANTVDPATSIPSTAVSWGINLRADKDRYFKEPGFLFGVTVARPKVYLNLQKGPGAHLMQDAVTWLPIMLRDNDFSSMKQVTKAGGILPTATNDGFWVDIADLFMYGDQFIHNTVAASWSGGGPLFDMPTAGLNARYPTEAMVDALFKDIALNFMTQDGVCRFQILGTLSDNTPRGSAVGFTL